MDDGTGHHRVPRGDRALNQQTQVDTSPRIDEEQVAAYLREHPDFLLRHPELLELLEIRHATGPGAVSLIERQVDLLRAKVARLEDRLSRLVGNAEANEQRAGSVHRLARALVRAPTLAGVVRALTRVMREEFDIDAVYVGVLAPTLKRHDIEGLSRIEPNGRIAAEFADLFRTRMIECGPISERRVALLFPRLTPAPQSAAVVPLEKEQNLGLMVLASRDPKRFAPGQGKLFLEMTAELVAAALRARLG